MFPQLYEIRRKIEILIDTDGIPNCLRSSVGIRMDTKVGLKLG